MRFDRFFTYWALLLHIKPIFGNTYTTAVFVAICSQIIRNYIAKEPTSLELHILTHLAPLLLVKRPESFYKFESWKALLTLLCLYLVYHGFQIGEIYKWYQFSKSAFSGKI